jgi:hypothetical protein
MPLGGVGSVWEQKKLEARKCSKSRTVPQRQVQSAGVFPV